MTMKKKVLQVQGMGSQHCAMMVRGALQSFDAKIEVDLATKTVVVEYDEQQVSLEALKEAIEDQSYDVI
jgi:copper chaperone